jgi:hypothetical protein
VTAVLDLFTSGYDYELVLLHVFTRDTMPRFANHEPHDTDEWVREFRLAYAPRRPSTDRLVMRVGDCDRFAAEVAEEFATDLVIVSWSQDASPGRARVVKAVLGHGPTLFVPVDYTTRLAPPAPPTRAASGPDTPIRQGAIR